MKKINYFFIVTCLCASLSLSNQCRAQWSLTGNAGTAIATNFLGTTDNKGLIFRTNNVERMRFTAAGNLGLGTVAPVARFQVAGGSTTSLTGTGYIISGDPSGYNLSLDNNELQARYDSAASTLYLNYWGGNIYAGKNTTGYSPLIYGNASTNHIGIGGYDDASYVLNIRGDATYGGIVVQNHAALLPSAYFQKTGQGAAIFAEKTSTSSYSFTIQANSASGGAAVAAYATAENCNAVYASSSASNGIYAAGGGGAGDYAGYFNGNVYTTGVYASSDRNLKKNIRDLPNALSIIEKLQPKVYEYRNDGNYGMMKLPQGEQIGLIAQDVEAVLPGLVKESKFDTRWSFAMNATEVEKSKGEIINYKALNYMELIPVLIKGMQEQQDLITAQNKKIEELENKVSALLPANQGNSNVSNRINAAGALSQNSPNPFSSETRVTCTIPANAKNAAISISSSSGIVVRTYPVNANGSYSFTINAAGLAAGQYTYTLLVDGKVIESKKMIISR